MAVLCRCGHPQDAHSGSSVSGIPCKTCAVNRRGRAAKTCWGWWPPGAVAVQVDEHGKEITMAEGGDAHAPRPPGMADGDHMTGPAVATDPTDATAGPPPDLCPCGHGIDAHPQIRTICTTCGYTRLSNGHDAPNGFCMGWPHPLPTAAPSDLDQAIHAATQALFTSFDWENYDARDVAYLAVEAAWPYAEGVIANARAKVDRQREANAKMQQQVDDAKATARGATRKQRELEEQLQATWVRHDCGMGVTGTRHDGACVLARDHEGDHVTGQEIDHWRDQLAFPQCPECREPILPSDPTVIAYSTRYRVHEECGDDTDRAGINPLQATRDQLAETRGALAELFDLFHVLTLSPTERASVNVRDPKVIEARVRAALQDNPPAAQENPQ